MTRLYFVDQFHRIAAGWNQVEPAPGDHLTCGQSQHPVSDGVAMMVIVEQPGVNVSLAQRGLYGGKIHGQITILNNQSHLSESGFTTEDTKDPEDTEKILGNLVSACSVVQEFAGFSVLS